MRVGWFLLGVAAALIVGIAVASVYLLQGYVDTRADRKGGVEEQWLGKAMDASVERHAPPSASPITETHESLLNAAKLYGSRCAICHGSPANGNSQLANAFSPPAPQFFGDDTPDLEPRETFYIVKHGIRMTAMPAWGQLASDEQIWGLAGLLKHVGDKSVPADVTRELSQPQTAVLSSKNQ